MYDNFVEVWVTIHGHKYRLEFHLDILDPLSFPWCFDFGDGFRIWHPTLETCMSHIVQLQESGNHRQITPLITHQQRLDWYEEARRNGTYERIW